ncbi:MAG: T9SS type A sorting domain-containing protein [Candidatus Kapabacteria bacterium]|nr:T9SS type A sorting domain-containing protein [Candidatus Kapabacteria bacterium]
MYKLKIKFSISALMILLISINSHAQTSPKELFQELRTQLNNYKTNNIIPSLSKWKNQLDNAMAKDDLTKLNELRSQATALRERIKSEAKEMNKNSDPEQKKENMKGIWKQNTEQFKALAEQLKPIAVKYKSTLEDIGTFAKPNAETWKNEIKSIVESWKNSHSDELKQIMDKPGAKEKLENFKQKMNFLQNFKKKAVVARFMLWDGKDINFDEVQNSESNDLPENPLNKSMITALQNYPNPFADKTTIAFHNPIVQQLTVTVIDDEGKTVAKVHDGKLAAGDITLTFEAKNLVTGSYLYKIKSSEWTKTGLMNVRK